MGRCGYTDQVRNFAFNFFSDLINPYTFFPETNLQYNTPEMNIIPLEYLLFELHLIIPLVLRLSCI